MYGGGPAPGDRLFRPLERLIYRAGRIDPEREQPWSVYARSVIAFSLVSVLGLYVLERLQGWLPLNPSSVESVPPFLAFNTAVSFVTNTNWQNYGGESTMSDLTQMLGLTVQNFASAAVGMAVAVALIRGLTRHRSETIGNFWVDLTRGVTRVLLPLALVLAVVLAGLGVVQTLQGPVDATTVEGATQTIYRGPIASQESIKEVGTNGGGVVNANSAHPFENPTGLTNFLEILALLLIPFALTYAFGRLVRDQRQGWAIFFAMFALWAGSVATATYFEVRGNPRVEVIGGQHGGQGSALRGRDLGALRCLDDRHLDRRGGLLARQLHARRRSRAAGQHAARRGVAGRRGSRAVRHAGLRSRSPCSSPASWSGGRPSTSARRSRRPR